MSRWYAAMGARRPRLTNVRSWVRVTRRRFYEVTRQMDPGNTIGGKMDHEALKMVIEGVELCVFLIGTAWVLSAWGSNHGS